MVACTTNSFFWAYGPLTLILTLGPLAGCERAPRPGGKPGGGEPGASGHAGVAPAPPQPAKVQFPEVPIRAGATTTVRVAWTTPAGTGVNEDAPFKVRWDRSDALVEAPADVKATGTAARDGFKIAVTPMAGAPNATLGGTIELVVCDIQTHSTCLPVRRAVELEFVVGRDTAAETTVTLDLPQARVL